MRIQLLSPSGPQLRLSTVLRIYQASHVSLNASLVHRQLSIAQLLFCAIRRFLFAMPQKLSCYKPLDIRILELLPERHPEDNRVQCSLAGKSLHNKPVFDVPKQQRTEKIAFFGCQK